MSETRSQSPRQPVKNLGLIGIEYRHEQRPAIVDLWDPENPRVVTYPEYHDACDAVGKGLVEHGLKPGDRVGLVCSNRAAFLEIFYGTMRAGAVPVMIGTQLPKETVEWIISDSGAKLVFCEAGLRHLLPAGLEVIDIDSTGPDGLAAFKKPGAFEPFVPYDDDVAFQPYTSGSTGRPKGVILSHRAHVWVANTISKDRDFAPSDRMVVAAPLYHKHAMNSIKCVLVGGSTVVLLKKFDPRRYIEAVKQYRATVVSGVPTIFAMMLQQRDLLEGQDFSFVRLATMGGAPATDALIDAVATQFPSAEIVTIFGITEASAALFGRHPEGLPRPRHSIGWPIAGNKFKLVGGEDENFGTLYVQGPGLMNGYHNNPAEMEKRMKDGWYNTGDILRRDVSGWWYFVGRGDDMFVSSGHNIYPSEVEVMLERHPEIDQALVVPAPDEIRYTIPYAFIVKRTGTDLSEKAVQDYALKNAPPYQHPRKVIFLPAMPMNGVGKIDRKALAARAAEMVETAKGKAS